MAGECARFLDDDALDLDRARFEEPGKPVFVEVVVSGDPVVAYQGIGETEDLACVGGVGHRFRVADHPGVEDNLADGIYLSAKTSPEEHRAVLKQEQRLFGFGHSKKKKLARWGFKGLETGLCCKLSGRSANQLAVKTGYGWLWNAIDAETKFQLASVITSERNVEDARAAFQAAKETAFGAVPHTVVTDGLKAYGPAFRKEFYDNHVQTEWVRAAGLRAIRQNNNLAERLHNTIRERVKVQRGWKAWGTPLAEGQRIYYNFIRPNQSLNNKTPAEAAGIRLELSGNRWIRLIQMAAEAEQS